MGLTIEQQIFICKNDGKLTSGQMSLKLQEPRAVIREELEILKSNGLYEQYRNLSDDDIAEKMNEATPLQYKTQAEEILREYKFRKGIIGYECWKELIALLLYQPSYRKESLTKVIYPIIATKCKMKTINPIAVANALGNSLKEIQLDGQTVLTFLERIGIVMEKSKREKKEAEPKEVNALETIKEETAEAEPKEDKRTTIEEIYVKVPLKILFDYYYLKGYFDGERKNKIQNELKWRESESLYEKDE